MSDIDTIARDVLAVAAGKLARAREADSTRADLEPYTHRLADAAPLLALECQRIAAESAATLARADALLAEAESFSVRCAEMADEQIKRLAARVAELEAELEQERSDPRPRRDWTDEEIRSASR